MITQKELNEYISKMGADKEEGKRIYHWLQDIIDTNRQKTMKPRLMIPSDLSNELVGLHVDTLNDLFIELKFLPPKSKDIYLYFVPRSFDISNWKKYCSTKVEGYYEYGSNSDILQALRMIKAIELHIGVYKDKEREFVKVLDYNFKILSRVNKEDEDKLNIAYIIPN